MRAVFVSTLCVAFVVVGFVFTFNREPVLPSPSEPMPSTSEQGDSRAGDAPAALTCIQNALGGTGAFANVSALRITADTKPAASTGFRPLPGTRTISVVFPDRYKRVDLGRPMVPGSSTLGSTIGFNGRALVSSPRFPDEEAGMRVARLDFARQMLMRLPRASGVVSMSQRLTRDAGQERLALDASGPNGFAATLLADSTTCVPIALQYEGRDRSGSPTVRVDLAEYREFGGIRFPTVLKTSNDGRPFAEEYVSEVEVNARDADDDFARDR